MIGIGKRQQTSERPQLGRVRLRLDAFHSLRLSFCAHHAFNDAILSKTPDIMPGQYR